MGKKQKDNAGRKPSKVSGTNSGRGPGEPPSGSRAIALPTKEEIERLPFWAQVAFAARCARRVKPLYVYYSPKAAQADVDAIDRALKLSVLSDVVDDHYVAHHDALDAARAAEAAASHSTARRSAAAARAAAKSANSNAGTRASYSSTIYEISAAVSFAADAANDARWSDLVRSRMRADFELLRRTAELERWTHQTPVPPEFFGPMWPDGAPEGWPVDEAARDAAPPVMKIEIVVPAGMNESESKEFNERVAKFYAALSGLHASMGGTGLRILDEDSCSTAPAEKEAPHDTPHDTDGVETPTGGGRERRRGSLVGSGGAR